MPGEALLPRPIKQHKLDFIGKGERKLKFAWGGRGTQREWLWEMLGVGRCIQSMKFSEKMTSNYILSIYFMIQIQFPLPSFLPVPSANPSVPTLLSTSPTYYSRIALSPVTLLLFPIVLSNRGSIYSYNLPVQSTHFVPWVCCVFI